MTRFTVIIPLEVHRGMAVECIRAWATGQDAPRESFELLIAAPVGHDADELKAVRALLQGGDRLIEFPMHHDLALSAAGAREAHGEVLVFTESHCLPNPDIISRANAWLDANPDWSGFSGGSIPITHGMLTEIEAEMYGSDTDYQLTHHPWLKVLDACFIVRRSAYEASGGLEPEYGHFAEWLLAARLHHVGAKINYIPEIAIHHSYIGRLDDLIEFTEDFARGQARFDSLRGRDECAEKFDEVPIWQSRFEYERGVAWNMARLMWRNLREDVAAPLAGSERKKLRLKHFLTRAIFGAWLDVWALKRTAAKQRSDTERYLLSNEKAGARESFLSLIRTTIQQGHLAALRDCSGGDTRDIRKHFQPQKKSGKWAVSQRDVVVHVGLHSVETFNGQSFCWTKPEAMIRLPLGTGEYRIRLRWLDFGTQLPTEGRYRFYKDEERIPSMHLFLMPEGIEILVHVSSKDGMRLSWTCEPFESPGDTRDLGMPLIRIEWKRKSRAKETGP